MRKSYSSLISLAFHIEPQARSSCGACCRKEGTFSSLRREASSRCERHYRSLLPPMRMLTKSLPSQRAVKDHHIVVFSKSYCVRTRFARRGLATYLADIQYPIQPYSKRAKQLIASIPDKKSEPVIFELDTMLEDDQGAKIQAYLMEKTGQRTVPNIFIGHKHIGGADAINELHEKGELVKLLLG